MENTLKELANASEKMNPIHAVAYFAIWDWLADVAPADIMPLLCEKCTEELLADYDITPINEENTIRLVKEMLDQGLDHDTAAALCRGFKTMNK